MKFRRETSVIINFSVFFFWGFFQSINNQHKHFSESLVRSSCRTNFKLIQIKQMCETNAWNNDVQTFENAFATPQNSNNVDPEKHENVAIARCLLNCQTLEQWL